MEQLMDRLFGEKGMGVCAKDKDLNVTFQNDVAKKFCHSRKGGVCDHGCMTLFVANQSCQARSEGFQLFVDRKIKDQFLDIAILNNGHEFITLMYPLGNKHSREMEFFKDKGLSRRENEVIERVVQGATNTQIMKELAISKATLKTHLNNIYKKLPTNTRVGFRRRMANTDLQTADHSPSMNC